MRHLKYLTTVLALALFLTINSAAAQSLTLPNDLIFAGIPSDSIGAVLLRLDANTLQITPFYEDNLSTIGRINVLSWSPDRKRLAIYRSLIPDRNNFQNRIPQICIIKRDGILLQCMDELPYINPNKYGESQIQSLTWSTDGSKIYFMASDKQISQLRLVEVDAQTGKTLQTLSEFNTDTKIIWSYTLDYFAQEQREPSVSGNSQATFTYLPTNTAFQPQQRVDLLSQSAHFDRLCPETSPMGQYFVIMGGESPTDKFTIFDRQGQIAFRVSSSSFPDLEIESCPSWQQDEQVLYFRANTPTNETARIFRYSLQDKRLTVFYRISDTLSLNKPGYGGSVGRLQISPDGRFIAAQSTEGGIVVYPADGERIQITHESLSEASSPLWVPPLNE